jgi:hypothetical protein
VESPVGLWVTLAGFKLPFSRGDGSISFGIAEY